SCSWIACSQGAVTASCGPSARRSSPPPPKRVSPMSQKVLDALKARHGSAVTHTESQHGDEIAWIQRDALVTVATWLRDDASMALDAPVSAPCIDRLDWNPMGHPHDAWTEDKPRFEVCYQLRSQKHKHRIRLKVAVPEHDARCPSLAEVWPAFNWQER